MNQAVRLLSSFLGAAFPFPFSPNKITVKTPCLACGFASYKNIVVHQPFPRAKHFMVK